MLKISVLTILLLSSLNSNPIGEINSSFITQKEYGKMLYENPRGIGCNKCHGDDGTGSFIASYKHRSKKEKEKKSYTITASNIRNIDFELFKKAVNNLSLSKKEKQILNRAKKHISIMPQYFLTDEELKSIHFYLNSLN